MEFDANNSEHISRQKAQVPGTSPGIEPRPNKLESDQIWSSGKEDSVWLHGAVSEWIFAFKNILAHSA